MSKMEQLDSKKYVDYEILENIAIVTINNPPVNTLSKNTINGLHTVLSHLEEEPDVKVVLLKGQNGHFVAGAELKEFTEIHTRSQATEESYLGHYLMERIECFDIPVIALIDGACLGGGLEVALACHYRIGTTRSIYGLPEVTLGMIPGAGGTQRLPKVTGPSIAKRMILTGEKIDANKAQQWGIIDEVCEEKSLLEEGMTLAQKISRNGKTSIQYALKAVNEGLYGSGKEGYRIEAKLFGACFETEDKKIRIQKFLQKK